MIGRSSSSSSGPQRLLMKVGHNERNEYFFFFSSETTAEEGSGLRRKSELVGPSSVDSRCILIVLFCLGGSRVNRVCPSDGQTQPSSLSHTHTLNQVAVGRSLTVWTLTRSVGRSAAAVQIREASRWAYVFGPPALFPKTGSFSRPGFNPSLKC